MLKPKDKVKVRDEYLHMVSFYQLKPLSFRPLIGEVVEVDSKGRKVKVDFSQREYPIYNGAFIGDKARVHGRHGGKDGMFPVNILEKVA